MMAHGPKRNTPAWKAGQAAKGRGQEEMCTPSPVFTARQGVGREEAGREGWGWGSCLRVAYLCSVFARHPWHAPFSLKEETRETVRRGPDSGPKVLALEAWPARMSVRVVAVEAWDDRPACEELEVPTIAGSHGGPLFSARWTCTRTPVADHRAGKSPRERPTRSSLRPGRGKADLHKVSCLTGAWARAMGLSRPLGHLPTAHLPSLPGLLPPAHFHSARLHGWYCWLSQMGLRPLLFPGVLFLPGSLGLTLPQDMRALAPGWGGFGQWGTVDGGRAWPGAHPLLCTPGPAWPEAPVTRLLLQDTMLGLCSTISAVSCLFV